MTSRDLKVTDEQEGVYDNKAGVLPNLQPSTRSTRAPSFDDPTYSLISRSKAPNIDQSGELPVE